MRFVLVHLWVSRSIELPAGCHQWGVFVCYVSSISIALDKNCAILIPSRSLYACMRCASSGLICVVTCL